MSEHYFCPHHGTDCQDVPDDLGNFCEFADRGVAECTKTL